MIEKVIESLAGSIKNVSGMAVYTEKISQGLEKPCIFAECEKVEKINLLGDRYFFRVHAKVTIESDSDTRRYDTESLLADILLAMSMIDAGGVKIRGRKIVSSWNESNMEIKAVYDIFATKADSKDLMETIERKQEW